MSGGQSKNCLIKLFFCSISLFEPSISSSKVYKYFESIFNPPLCIYIYIYIFELYYVMQNDVDLVLYGKPHN